MKTSVYLLHRDFITDYKCAHEVISTILLGDLVVEIINQHIAIVNHIYLSSGSLFLARPSKEVTHKSKVFTDYGHSYISLVEMKIVERRCNVWLRDSRLISVSTLSATT